MIELLDNLAELALALWAEPAKSAFLYPVRDGAQQQLAAEMRRGVGFVERAPLLAKLDKAELGEARQRLPTRPRIWKRAAHVGSAIRWTRPRSSFAEARVSPSFFFKVPEKTPRTV